MTDRGLIAILVVLVFVLFFSCLAFASERTHWKRNYEQLRNDALRLGTSPHSISMTLDEFIDSQG